ncbi:MAG: transcription termination/antitermination NusG family protein [bacterium]|jgi:transcriptional antiterminator RfaH
MPESRWYVLHVKPRCEKKMAEYCAVKALKHDLPLRQETKVYQRRRVTVHKPVFPGYVFIAFSDDEKLTVLKSNFIVHILNVLDQDKLVHELAQIDQALAVDPSLDACAAFQAGKRVTIRSGPFQGLEGVVQMVRGKTKVILNVEMIGRAVAVEVAVELLDPEQ